MEHLALREVVKKRMSRRGRRRAPTDSRFLTADSNRFARISQPPSSVSWPRRTTTRFVRRPGSAIMQE